METWNQPDSYRGGGSREWWKEGEGTSQRTCMNDPWTWKTVWELPVEWEVGWVEESKGGKFGTAVIK